MKFYFACPMHGPERKSTTACISRLFAVPPFTPLQHYGMPTFGVRARWLRHHEVDLQLLLPSHPSSAVSGRREVFSVCAGRYGGIICRMGGVRPVLYHLTKSRKGPKPLLNLKLFFLRTVIYVGDGRFCSMKVYLVGKRTTGFASCIPLMVSGVSV